MKRLISILLAVLLVAALSVSVLAVEEHAARQPDYSKTGSIAVDIKTATGVAVGGGTLTAYLVAEAKYDDGDNFFEFTDDFKDCGLDLTEIDSAEPGAHDMAAQLVSYANSGTTVSVDDSGHADFTDLALGLYLIVQETPAEEYDPINPFLVTVPFWDGEQLVYDVEAEPKPGTAIALAKYDPPVEKLVEVISGTAPADSEFVFRMTPSQPGYPMPENDEATIDSSTGALTMTQKGEGTYEFGWMYFGVKDVGKTYTYTIEEVAGYDAHYTYNAMIYTLTIVVNQDEETEEISLDISCKDSEGNDGIEVIKFINEYKDDPPPPTPTPTPKLPQTGQLWWPVPVLAGIGIAAFLLGLSRRRRESDE